MYFDIFYSNSLKINPLNWFHGPLVGYHPQSEKQRFVLCMADEIIWVDGKKRHFGLIRSNLPSCLYRRGGIMVWFRMNFQLFCTRLHFSVWYVFAFCQVLGSNHFCSNIISKMSGNVSKSFDSWNSETINQQYDESLHTHNTCNNQWKHSRNEERKKET